MSPSRNCSPAGRRPTTRLYERYLERFQREARATGTIQQPNVVTVYDLHVDAAGNNYLVMEYVDGTNLRDLLAQVGTLPVGRAIAVATDLARALEAVHEQEIVHRDIKPANIMITRRGVAKLMDFGIAQVGHESLRTQVASGHPGTPIYMSPEQASGYGYIDGRSDLYALGLILYEMLAGEPYARRRRPLGAVREDLPPRLVAVVDRLTTREIDARYQSASDVLADLEALGTTLTPTATDAYPLPDADTTRVATPPTAGWPTGTSATMPPPAGVPSSYGGPSSQPPVGTTGTGRLLAARLPGRARLRPAALRAGTTAKPWAAPRHRRRARGYHRRRKHIAHPKTRPGAAAADSHARRRVHTRRHADERRHRPRNHASDDRAHAGPSDNRRNPPARHRRSGDRRRDGPPYRRGNARPERPDDLR